MRPRVVGAVVAAVVTVLLLLLMLANYNIYFYQQQTADNRSVTWFNQLRRYFSALFGFDLELEEESERYKPVEHGYLNYQRRYMNFVNSFVTATIAPEANKNNISTTNTTEDKDSQAKNQDPYQVQYNRRELVSVINSDEQSESQQQTDLLATYRMNREAIGKQVPKSDDDALRATKCHYNDYDRLIAQKIIADDISRPVIKPGGRFENPFSNKIDHSYVDFVKFAVLETDDSNVPKNKDELDKSLGQMVTPDFTTPLNQTDGEYRATWIGHATVLIQVDGYNILTDPIFSERASFTQLAGPKRIRPAACDIKSLPPIDIVLISHNHYDHLDTNSVQELNGRFGRDCRWIVPLGMGEFLKSMSVQNYVELDWWQKDCYFVNNPKSSANDKSGQLKPTNDSSKEDTMDKITADMISSIIASQIATNHQMNHDHSTMQRPEISVYMTPSLHWSRRGLNDVNKSLWGSFTIVSKSGSTFFFGGDTGYCPVFKEIGQVFGPFTGAAIPIGAYKPRWFLKAMHVDPEEAVQIHKDLRCMKSISIHHATFILSKERFDEPSRLLKEIMDKTKVNGVIKDPFISLRHGESTDFCKTC